MTFEVNHQAFSEFFFATFWFFVLANFAVSSFLQKKAIVAYRFLIKKIYNLGFGYKILSHIYEKLLSSKSFFDFFWNFTNSIIIFFILYGLFYIMVVPPLPEGHIEKENFVLSFLKDKLKERFNNSGLENVELHAEVKTKLIAEGENNGSR